VQSGNESETLDAAALAQTRKTLAARGLPADAMSDADIQAISAEIARRFRDEAPTTAEQAATIILDGVKADRWRILVGDDAHAIDSLVRADPEEAYEPEFFQEILEKTGWRIGV
jgi:hypothetical protein